MGGTNARTPYWPAMSWHWSTSHLVNATLPGTACLLASDSKVGAMALQGPHQVAWTVGGIRISVLFLASFVGEPCGGGAYSQSRLRHS